MENSYEQLIDDYNNGVLVQAGESLTDYINRMGGVDYKANGGIITALRIGLANGSDVEGKIDLMGDLSKEDKKTFAELKKLLFDATIQDRPSDNQSVLEAIKNPSAERGSIERARAFDRAS